MIVKSIIVLFLIIILYSLGSALYYLVREGNNASEADASRVVKALSWRIGLSLFLFFMLFLAYALGWITPHSIGR